MEIQPAVPNPHSQTLFIPLSEPSGFAHEGRRSGSDDRIPVLGEMDVGPPESCRICEETLSLQTSQRLPGCDHNFCKECFLDYLKVTIGERKTEDMKCPSFGCENKLQDALLKDKLPSELYGKLMRFRRYNELEKNVNFRWCPRPDCEGHDIGDPKRLKLTCNECGFVFCFYCGEEWHASGKCRAEGDKKLDRWAKYHHAKFCPNCKMRVQKMKGCDHMTCFKCQYQWCWLCGDHYTPPHYESCPVKRLRKRNPPWRIVFLLLFLPLLFPFSLVIGMCFLIEEQIAKVSPSTCWNRFIKKRILSYPILGLIALSVTPLVLALVILFVFVGILAEFGRYFRYEKNCLGALARRRCLWVAISVTLGISLAPVAGFILFAGVGGSPIVALFCILQKAVIGLIRCCQPGFMRPSIVPGYALG